MHEIALLGGSPCTIISLVDSSYYSNCHLNFQFANCRSFTSQIYNSHLSSGSIEPSGINLDLRLTRATHKYCIFKHQITYIMTAANKDLKNYESSRLDHFTKETYEYVSHESNLYFRYFEMRAGNWFVGSRIPTSFLNIHYDCVRCLKLERIPNLKKEHSALSIVPEFNLEILSLYQKISFKIVLTKSLLIDIQKLIINFYSIYIVFQNKVQLYLLNSTKNTLAMTNRLNLLKV
ncbi:hypothetical protein AGLY_006371 [Aphis glycines]|uniref:Uncharacterized protein n=1 Tax=Aphis glycines TaxID=307491 RepID=A0A6G0TS45_APHGL|nr:hypothetical protein AGLY_006371 [Aphis glycines]